MNEKQQDYREYYTDHGSEKKPRKKIFIGIVCFLAFAVLLIAGWLIFYNYNLSPVGTSDQSVIVNIPQGTSIEEIGNILNAKKLIRNQMVFKSYAGMNSRGEQSIQAGVYEFKQNMSTREIVDKMLKGEIYKGENSITIPEGKTLWEIGDMLQARGICGSEDFIKEASKVSEYKAKYPILKSIPDGGDRTLEGYLFADTYFWGKGTKPEVIVSAMLDRFVSVFDEQKQEAAKKIGRSVDEIVILASIVEAETKLAEDRTTVASVLYNRLAIDMPLQVDSTVNYGMGQKIVILSTAQTAVDSPYNTYTNKGLPVGPICAPSEGAFEAVLNPAKTDYLYFVSDLTTGKMHFNETIEGHDDDVAEHMY